MPLARPTAFELKWSVAPVARLAMELSVRNALPFRLLTWNNDAPLARVTGPRLSAPAVPLRASHWMPPLLSVIGAVDEKRLETACTPVSFQMSAARLTVIEVAFSNVP